MNPSASPWWLRPRGVLRDARSPPPMGELMDSCEEGNRRCALPVPRVLRRALSERDGASSSTCHAERGAGHFARTGYCLPSVLLAAAERRARERRRGEPRWPFSPQRYADVGTCVPLLSTLLIMAPRECGTKEKGLLQKGNRSSVFVFRGSGGHISESRNTNYEMRIPRVPRSSSLMIEEWYYCHFPHFLILS